MCCDVPLLEAPAHFTYDSDNHCFVTRQPETPDEMTRVLRAALNAETSCIRYRGTDQRMIRRLAECGLTELSDVRPAEVIDPVYRNHVSFSINHEVRPEESPSGILARYREHLTETKGAWRNFEFTPIVETSKKASFSYSWSQRNFHEIEVLSIGEDGRSWLLRHSLTDKTACHSISLEIDDWLKAGEWPSAIRWYSEEEWIGERQGQDIPI